jgi:endoglucanase
VAFGNEVWSDNEVPATHHNEADYIRVKNMHMNVIRFYLNYKTFESDSKPYTYKETGWNWINQNISWAKKHGIYLILNMHAPQGGYQSQGKGDALWTDQENQRRLCSLWAAIATKYKDEKQIAGFGPVNEPVPTVSMAQWTDLASRLASSIRQNDTNHILFIEKAIYVKGAPEDNNLNFPVITDKNIAFEFHMYDPYLFTHQQFSWSGLGDGGKYPDENIIAYTNASWYTATFNNPSLAPGNADWNYVEGVKYKVTDPKIRIAFPALIGASVGGRAYFDDIIIKEFDATGNFVRDVFKSSLDSANGWYYWSANGSGRYGIANIGKSNGKSIFIEESTGDCNVSLSDAAFIPVQNYSYQVSGWLKGENVANGSGVKLRIDFSETPDPIYGRNKTYMEAVLKRFNQWSVSRNVPLYMGEFGTGTPTFNNKGGLTWVSDVLSIAKSNRIHFSYHAYHEDSFGLYYGYGTLPDPSKANQPLIDLLTNALK